MTYQAWRMPFVGGGERRSVKNSWSLQRLEKGRPCERTSNPKADDAKNDVNAEMDVNASLNNHSKWRQEDRQDHQEDVSQSQSCIHVAHVGYFFFCKDTPCHWIARIVECREQSVELLLAGQILMLLWKGNHPLENKRIFRIFPNQ